MRFFVGAPGAQVHPAKTNDEAEGAGMSKLENFVKRAQKLKAEIDQIFMDAAHWNECVRKASEVVIDPDPGGDLDCARKSLERFIADVTHGVGALRKMKRRGEQ